jgi:hypothetical protein
LIEITRKSFKIKILQNFKSLTTQDIKKSYTANKSSSNSQEECSQPKVETNSANKISIDEFTFIRVLGKGSFGKVHFEILF